MPTTTIKQLPSHVISLIAAGEIAERPSGVIKELIENSLDAKATQIEITLEDAGLKKITVADNGHGMTSEDLPLSVLSHATSKIEKADDLDSIVSYGFRGEALASIAKVSQVTIMSRHVDEPMAYTFSHQSQRVSPSKIGMNIGTVVDVKDLFANIPARKKFMNSSTTELRHILEVVETTALANPEVGFTLYHNQKKLVHFPAQQSLKDRFLQIIGWDLEEYLLPVSDSGAILSVEGFIGNPVQSRPNTNTQWLFVNGRPVVHQQLQKTIKQAYQSALPPEKYPLFVLSLRLDPSLFDINRHPKKETVAFMDEQMIQDVVRKIIAQKIATVPNTFVTYGNLTMKEPGQAVDSVASAALFNSAKPNHRGHFPAENFIARKLKSLLHPISQVTTQSAFQEVVPVLQINNTYLVTEHENQLVMVDQHAAHERILFEAFRSLYSSEQAKEPTELQPPLSCNLTPTQTQLLKEHAGTLEKIGFLGHFLGEQTYAVTAVPNVIPIEQTKRILLDLLDDLATGNPVSLVDSVAHRTIAYLACRSAVMAGDPLDEKERRDLLTKLFKTPNYQTCPHGRPTVIVYDNTKLEKLFGRA